MATLGTLITAKLMTPTNSSPNKTDLKEALQLAAKLVPTFLAVGYIGVQIHLSRYGYYSLSLFRVQYLAATVWALIPLVSAWLFLSRAVYPFLTNYLWSGSRYKRIVALVTLLLGWVAAFILVFIVAFFPESRWIARQTWLDRTVVMVVFSCFVISIPWALNEKARIKSLRGASRLTFLVKEAPILALVFALVLYMGAFARFFYPEVPATLGGGKPLQVRIIVGLSERQALTASGVSFREGSLQSEPVDLLLVTPESYVIIPSEDKAIEIQRDLVRMVIYER